MTFLRYLSLPLVLAACNKEPLALAKSSSTAVQEKNNTVPASFSIHFIPKSADHTFWHTMKLGALAAAHEEHVRLTWSAPGTEGVAAIQAKLVDDAATQGAQGLILAPQDAWVLSPAVDGLFQRSIPVVVVDSDIGTDHIASYIATDNIQAGAMAAEQLALALQGKGKVLLFRFLAGAPATTRREEAFLEELRQHFPEIQVLSSSQYAGPTAESAYQAAKALLPRYQDKIDGVFCPNEPSCLGLYRAMEKLQLQHLKFVGFDANAPLLDGLRQGRVQALIVQDPYDMGYTSVKQMVAKLRGDPVKRHISTKLAVVSAANMDSERIRQLLPR